MDSEPLRHQAAGGWRRAVTGLFVGVGLGALVRWLLRDEPPS